MKLVVHGGVGSPAGWKDGCRRAAAAGWDVLQAGGDALAAAVRAVVSLEDDGRYNAGLGANLRLDGKTVQRDAGVMDSKGRLGAVAAIEGFQNPIRIAVDVSATPHILLAGEGAGAFARAMGHKQRRGVPAAVRSRHREAIARMLGPKPPPAMARWREIDVAAIWNFEGPVPEWVRAGLATDRTGTVGAVAADAAGGFATANSTGGTSFMLRGRVGDSPLVGAGYYAGPEGAVAVTGVGEEIARRLLSKTVYDWISAGTVPQAACERGLTLFGKDTPVGLIAVGRAGLGHAANRSMAWHGRGR